MHSLETIIARNKAQQDSFDNESKTINPKNGDKKMETLFDQFVTEKTEAGLINGLVDMIHASWDGKVSAEQLYSEFPDGPDAVVNTFRSRYPDVAISSNKEIHRQVESKLNPEITKAMTEFDPVQELIKMLNSPTGYVTAPNCKDPDCMNPECRNYKGRRRLSGKSKIGYIN